MTRGEPSGTSGEGRPDWDEAVSQATRHIDERTEARSAAGARSTTGGRKVRVVTLYVAVVGVLAWNGGQWMQPVEPMPAALERVNLAWTVLDVVETVEDFVVSEGRLPTPLDLAETLLADVEYTLTDSGYRVVAHGDGGSLVYDASRSVEEWMAQHASGGVDGGQQ